MIVAGATEVVDRSGKVSPIISNNFLKWICALSLLAAVFSLAELIRGLLRGQVSSRLVPRMGLSPFQNFEGGQYGSIANDANVGEDASYESLLALSDAIGCVRKGLSLEQISLVCTRLEFPEAVSSVETAETPASCAVCLMKFAPGDTLLALPCACRYHEQCVKPWLQSSPTCPCCRSFFR